MEMEATLKNRLLCLGMKAPDELKEGRKWGAGPAGGRFILLRDSVANVPIFGFAEDSPIQLLERDGNHYIGDRGEETKVNLLDNPGFYDSRTSDGVQMRMIALAHGNRCLGSTVFQRCVRWERGDQCKFCGIELSLKHGTTLELKKPHHLAEVCEAAEGERFNHVTLTTGTPNLKDRGSTILASATQAVKENTKMRVHVQIEPVAEKEIDLMHSAGADSIGIHIESLDRSTLGRVCPGKAGEYDVYFKAWEVALGIFGRNQVSSYIILGLGEERNETLAGIDRMCERGIIPFIVPLRPLEETPLQDLIPPRPEDMEEYYLYACESMREHGIDPTKNLAGCVRCGGCSALMDYYRG